MKIGIIVGSISKNSNNMKIGKFLVEEYKQDFDMNIIDIKDLPMYNEDIELDPPETVKKLKREVKDSDALIFITREYNRSTPGVLKNALDWLSRVDRPLLGKPTMVIGATMGSLGTSRAQTHLRQILNSGGIACLNLPSNEVLISNIGDKLDENGNLIDQSTIDFLDLTMKNFIEWVKKVK